MRRCGADAQAEVALIKCRNRVGVNPFSCGNDGRVDHPELQMGVLIHEIVDSLPVVGFDWVNREMAGGDRSGTQSLHMR
jgi:hypothetical protein